MNRTISTIRRTFARSVVTAVGALAIGVAVLPASPTHASMTGGAEVVCNAAQNRIEVTPRVVADTAGAQYTATRIWLAHFDGTKWNWAPGNWNVETASGNQNPMGAPIDRLSTRTLDRPDGYYYVYVQSFMWNGQSWYGGTGAYTSSYTQLTPSVSHEPAQRTQETYCRL